MRANDRIRQQGIQRGFQVVHPGTVVQATAHVVVAKGAARMVHADHQRTLLRQAGPQP
ncbi:hypothetical protein D9M69_607950 [compost metagenome]